ncbi:transcriptional repressor TCF25-domain-containing protein [Cladochytrium replicatum]|nr:transcriptional repressor TCF25-domain-containing protein [Cladochytrium replicatum]
MASRAVRKLMRQKDELRNSNDAEPKVDDEEEELDEPLDVKKPNLFSALLGDEDDGPADVPSDVSEQESMPPSEQSPAPVKKSAKKKKKKPAAKTTTDEADEEPVVSSSARKGKKRVDTNATPIDGDEDSLDEIDRTLRDLNKKYGNDDSAVLKKASSSSGSAKNLLSVDPKLLDADAELRRMFGSRVVANEIKKKPHGRNKAVRRTMLATPTDAWPRLDSVGLSMERLTKDYEGQLHFSFVHSKQYQDLECRFFDCVATHNPQTIAHLLHMYPSHIDSLLQMSEITRHSGDHAMGAELIERALYCCERAFHPMFNISSGSCRLSYKRFENRSFFLALFRHMVVVARKSCWRTALELNKLTLGLDPEDDPLGSLLCIDFYAIKAREFTWLNRFSESLAERRDLSSMPNFAYSLALVRYELDADQQPDDLSSESSKLLQRAILSYPWTIPQLYEKCGVTDNRVTSSPHFAYRKSDESVSETTAKLLIDLYVERSYALWKEPEKLAWLRRNVEKALERFQSKADPDVQDGLKIRKTGFTHPPRNLLRHIFVSELSNSLNRALPSGISLHAYDPLPPEDAVPSVYDTYQNSRRATANPFRDMSALTAFLQSLMPWMVLEPEAQGGGGVDAGALPEEIGAVVREAAAAAAAAAGGGEGGEGNNNDGNAGTWQGRVEATIRAAQASLPGLFPNATAENPNPEWMQNIRATIESLANFGFGPQADAAPEAEREGDDPDMEDEPENR